MRARGQGHIVRVSIASAQPGRFGGNVKCVCGGTCGPTSSTISAPDVSGIDRGEPWRSAAVHVHANAAAGERGDPRERERLTPGRKERPERRARPAAEVDGPGRIERDQPPETGGALQRVRPRACAAPACRSRPPAARRDWRRRARRAPARGHQVAPCRRRLPGPSAGAGTAARVRSGVRRRAGRAGSRPCAAGPSRLECRHSPRSASRRRSLRLRVPQPAATA